MAEREGPQPPEQDPRWREPAPSKKIEELIADVDEKIGENAYVADQGQGVAVGYFRELGGERYLRVFKHNSEDPNLLQDLEERLEAGEVSQAYVNYERSLRLEIDDVAVAGISEEQGTYEFRRYTITEVAGEFHMEQIPMKAQVGGEILHPPLAPEHLAMLQEHDPQVVDYNLEMIGIFREEQRKEEARDKGLTLVSEIDVMSLRQRIGEIEAIPADADIWPV